MSKLSYAVTVERSMPGSYTRPDIFQDKTEAIEFANWLESLRKPGDKFVIRLYEFKELELSM